MNDTSKSDTLNSTSQTMVNNSPGTLSSGDGYYGRVNGDLLPRIPLTARKVLELGCGKGALGDAYKRRNPQAYYVGLELIPKAAEVARQRLDAVHVFNADTDALPEAVRAAAPFDAIVFGDVLEHLCDPWQVVRDMAALLGPEGAMVACIPNVQHWSFLDVLLRDGFQYNDEGLFDRTHLRWFGMKNMIELQQQAGLNPLEVWGRDFQEPEAEGFIAALAPAVAKLGISPAQFAQQSRPLQYVVRSARHKPQMMLLQSMMLRPVGGVNDVRIGRPFMAHNSIPGVDTTAEVRSFTMKDRPADHVKVMIWHRPVHHWQAAETLIRLIRRGYIVVTEFDDHTMRWPDIEKHDYLTLTGCHGVQTSTPLLADIFREHQSEVAMFPNTVLDLPDRRNFQSADKVTVFFGALNREQDWAPIMDGLNRAIASAAADPALPELHFAVIHDRGFFEALQTPNKQFTPTCEYEQYLDILGGCEVALLPLADTLFNRCKSDLKFVEAGAAGCAVLASPTAYADTLQDGETGRLVPDADGFGDALLALLRQPETLRRLGDQARAYVRDHRMTAQQLPARDAWYRKLWAEREQTTPKLLAHLETCLKRAGQ